MIDLSEVQIYQPSLLKQIPFLADSSSTALRGRRPRARGGAMSGITFNRGIPDNTANTSNSRNT